jgi:enterochelin esterase family protein
MGLGLNGGEEDFRAYERANGEALKRSAEQMKLVYYAMGKDDFLYSTAAPTIAMMKKHGLNPIYNESTGGHDWPNWRLYLADFAPRLFR